VIPTAVLRVLYLLLLSERSPQGHGSTLLVTAPAAMMRVTRQFD
jgi:inner membrane protein involved in colicin E2 resistance